MNAMSRMAGLATLALAAGLLLGAGGRSAPPPARGPARLDAAQQGQIDAVIQQRGLGFVRGDFEQAAQKAREMAALREKWQGKGHWQTMDARLEVEEWQRRARVADKDRPEVVRALTLLGEGDQLWQRRRYREAEVR